MILLARTTPLAEVQKKSRRHVDLPRRPARGASATGMTVQPIRNMVNHETNELFFDNLEIPAENLIGEEGKGFQLHPRRPERRAHADRRRMHRRRLLVHRPRRRPMPRNASCSTGPIGQNQGVQFPIAEAYIEVEAANLMRCEACRLFDAGAALRRRGQHGQVPGGQGVAGRRPTPACSSMAASALPPNTTSSASSARPGCTRWRRSRPT